jgi:stage II sporulation protein D
MIRHSNGRNARTRMRERFAIAGSIAPIAAMLILVALFSPARAGSRIPIVRIGIAPEVERVRIGCEGSWKIGVVGKRGEVEDAVGGSSWTFSAPGGLLRSTDERGRSRGGGTDTLYVFAGSNEGPPIQIDGISYRGEFLVFASANDRLTVVNVLDLESYLRGVLPEEIGTGGENGREAVKAQAVAARSYSLACLNRWRVRGFDMLATVGDQVYGGMASERPETDQAISETCGVVALSRGAPIEAYYSSTCGGMTTTPEEVWARAPLPYLTIHRDSPGKGEDSFCSASPLHRWDETWTGAEIEEILRSNLPAVTGIGSPEKWGPLKDISIGKRERSYRVGELRIDFAHRSFTVGGDKVRWILRRPNGEILRSALLLKVDVAHHKGRVKNVTIHGAGYGHGIGLCQMGALGMARAGYDYVRILHFYYRGAQLVRAYSRCPV